MTRRETSRKEQIAKPAHAAEYDDIRQHGGMEIERSLNIPLLLKEKIHFLFGPRGTGKVGLFVSNWMLQP